MTFEPVRIGVIGCGNISGVYLRNCARLEEVNIVACADRDLDRARAAATEFGVERSGDVASVLDDPAIELVLNLTPPSEHATVGRSVLGAGKHLYNEKPLAATAEEGHGLLQVALDAGLLVGCAPDTFLGAGLQTCRGLIDEGRIGEAVGGVVFMMCHGHESWHPDPGFYYEPGGGPLMDMGPYYLTALVSLLGPVRRVMGACATPFPTRTISSEPKRGTVIDVKTPTHIAAVLEFECSAIVNLVMSFDVWHHTMPPIEIYGTLGSMRVADPNTFDGPVYIRRHDDDDWREQELVTEHRNNWRGLGVADMARAIRCGTNHRANGELACHVLDVMHAVLESGERGEHITLGSSCPRPEPMALGESRG